MPATATAPPRPDWRRRIRGTRPRRWAARRTGASATALARPRLFLAPKPQQVTRSRLDRLPVADLLAAGATLGALALWGLALNLLAV